MFRQSPYFSKYSAYRYQGYYNNFNTTPYPYFNNVQIENKNEFQESSAVQDTYKTLNNLNNLTNKESSIFNQNTIEDVKDVESVDNEDIDIEKETNEPKFRFGPISYSNNNISLFGLSFALDDLIIIGVIILLLIESQCDYMTLIILGLILFNISFSSISNLSLFN